MQLKALRRVLQQIVIAGLPLAAIACTNDDGWIIREETDECQTTVERRFEISTPAETRTQFRIDACQLDAAACEALCRLAMDQAALTHGVQDCNVRFTEEAATVDVTYSYWADNPQCGYEEGRRPAGLAAPTGGFAPSEVGAWLAHAAWLEAASVFAFAQLAHELAAHGAPRKLVRWALSAARDEVNHAAVMTRLALRYGARPARPVVQLPPVRSLEVLAVENAAEGCVRETFAAALALWQSRSAADPAIRAALATIAEDEARHAGLAWAIDAWATAQLDAEARARITAARTAAAAQLATEIAMSPLDPRAAAVLGLPVSHHAQALVARTHHSLWGGLS